MVFSSEIFMFFFLPLFLIVYLLAPKKIKNLWLFISSLFLFYAWDKPSYSFLMIFSILLNFSSGLLIEKWRNKKNVAKVVLIISIILNLGLLGFYKYTDLFLSTANSLIGTSFSLLNLVLPIGISFYTFQTMSYTIDVYRNNCKVQKNLIDFGAYVTMFPQLIAGPIVRYRDIEGQLNNKKINLERFSSGALRFSFGLFKKAVIANSLGAVWEELSIMENAPALTAWFGAICFAFQIYFDFSGYSDMAIGLGRMIGFEFLENFNFPYLARSITDFWRRWHISLSTWFKEYVYISLGGNRKGLPRQILNLLIVWGLTGIWHGASWNFLLWGLYFGIILVLEKVFLLKLLEKIPKFFQHFYSLVLIIFGWVIFAITDFSKIIEYFKNMFNFSLLADGYSFYLILSNIAVLILAVVFSCGLPQKLWQKLTTKLTQTKKEICQGILVVFFSLISIMFIAGMNYNPFLYFRF